jgi:hypothetical protein
MTTVTPTKTDELATYRQFVEALPDGYLRDLLADSLPSIEQAVRSDIAGPWVLTDLLRAAAEARAKLADLQAKIATARQELDRIVRQHDAARAKLAELRTTAQQIANRIGPDAVLAVA